MNDDRHREKEYYKKLETYSSLLADSVLFYLKHKDSAENYMNESSIEKEAKELLQFLKSN